MNGFGDFAGANPDLDANPWLDTLLRFCEDLVRLADGRFPVCPPLLRSPGDVASAMLGGMGFVTGLIDQVAVPLEDKFQGWQPVVEGL